MRYYGYGEFVQDVKTLARQLEDFDTYVAVARGGLTLAHFLAEAKNVRNVVSVSVLGYEDTKRLDNVTVTNLPDLSQSENVLIVEDIVDSGRTIEALLKIFHERYPEKNFKVAALFYKKSAVVKPDFFVQYADDWIEFFWTKDIQ